MSRSRNLTAPHPTRSAVTTAEQNPASTPFEPVAATLRIAATQCSPGPVGRHLQEVAATAEDMAEALHNFYGLSAEEASRRVRSHPVIRAAFTQARAILAA